MVPSGSMAHMYILDMVTNNFTASTRHALGPVQLSVNWYRSICACGIKWYNKPSLSCAENKKEWIYTSTTSYASMTLCLTKHMKKDLVLADQFFFFVALRPNAGHGLLILVVSRSHTTTHHSR